jgi:hypothetical protein
MRRRLSQWLASVAVVAATGGCGSPGSARDDGAGEGGAASDGGVGDDAPSFGEGSRDCGSGGDLAGCPCSTPGASRGCWSGSAATRNVGACHDGTQACVQEGEYATWGACTGEVLDCGDASCGDPNVNTERGMIVAYSPAAGQAVGAAGQIVVWANDECPLVIAPGEKVDPSTGAITVPGNRSAKLSDGYLAEPALYVAPATAENGGTPHFPTAIKGGFNSSYPPSELMACDCNGGFVALQDAPAHLLAPDGGAATLVPMDPPPPGTTLSCFYTAEYVWDVPSLGLAPGTYGVELSIPDGDGDRQEACLTVLIQ